MTLIKSWGEVRQKPYVFSWRSGVCFSILTSWFCIQKSHVSVEIYYFILKYDTIPLHFKWYVSSFLEIPIVVLNSKIFMVLIADIFITICLDELWFTVFSEHSDSIFFPFYDLFLRSGAGLRDCLLFLTYPYL